MISLSFALRNIRKYPLKSVGNFVFGFVFAFLVLLTFFYSYFTEISLSHEMNLRSSGNYLAIKAPNEKIAHEIQSLDYVNETISLYQSFVSGELEIEGSSFEINSYLIYTNGGKIPSAFTSELHDLYYEDTFQAGGQIKNGNEIILNVGYFEELGFKDVDSLIGKTISISYDWLGEKNYVVQNAVLAGLTSEKMRSISYFDDSSLEIAFLPADETMLRQADLLSFFHYDDLERVNKDLGKFSEEKIFVMTKGTVALDKLSDLVQFVTKILTLMIVLVLLVYFVFFVSLILDGIRSKSEFLIAIDACGFRRKNLCLSLIFELFLIFAPGFIIALILSFFAAGGLLSVTANFIFASVFYQITPTVVFPIAGLFLGVVLLDMILVWLSVYVFSSRANI